jgi:hypothetical protein
VSDDLKWSPDTLPPDCGVDDGHWAPCPDWRQWAAGQPCPCAGWFCCQRHRSEELEEYFGDVRLSDSI